MLYGFIDTRAQTFTFFITSPRFFDCNSLMECALMIKLIPLYYLENLLPDEIFEGGMCSLKGQRSPNKHLFKCIYFIKAFLIYFNVWVINL